MSVTAGEILGYKAPGAGETVRLPVMMLDSAGAAVTGVTFDAAGMAVETKKEGESSFTAFPTFDTNNWDEIGYGLYEVIIRQSDAGELALLDTTGAFALYVKCTATRGDINLFKVNAADVARPGAEMDLVDAPNATAVTAIQSGLAPADVIAALAALDFADYLATPTATTFFDALALMILTQAGRIALSGAPGAKIITVYDRADTPVTTFAVADDYSTRGQPA